MRILVADKSEEIRKKFVQFIGDIPGIHIVGEASTWANMIRLISDLKPDVVALDVQVLEPPELVSIQQLKSLQPQPSVMILSNTVTPEYERAYQNAGAHYVFDKSLGFEKIVETLTALRKS